MGRPQSLATAVGFIPFPGKNHPEITPFGYWLVSTWSVMLLRGTILTRRFQGLFRRFRMYVLASSMRP